MNKSKKPRYDVLLAQLEYIKDKAAKRLDLNGGMKNDESFDYATDKLSDVCMRLNDSSTECPPGFHLEDGMCVAN